jgi:hypothetical protein
MRPNYIQLVFALAISITRVAFASNCAAPTETLDSTHGDARASLSSPDRNWEFVSEGSTTWQYDAKLHLLDRQTKRLWKVGSLGRNGTAFWSSNGKELLLRDEYAADDMKLRVLHLIGPRPQEIHGLDRAIKRAVLSRIPNHDSTLWITYPEVCFSADQSSKILLTVDAPHAPSRGGTGTDLRMRLIVDLSSLRVSEVPGSDK